MGSIKKVVFAISKFNILRYPNHPKSPKTFVCLFEKDTKLNLISYHNIISKVVFDLRECSIYFEHFKTLMFFKFFSIKTSKYV